MQRLTRAVVLSDYSETHSLTVGPANLPLLQPNQVLVRMEFANVSTRDLTFLQGKSPVVRALPAVPGLEGSGTVVEAGSKLKAWRFQGKRVGLFALESGLPGSWAEYVVVSSRHCFPLNDSVSFEQAAGMFICPLTVCMFEEQLGKARAIIQTGGTSSVAKAMLRLCNYRSIACVCVISDPSEAAALADLGAKYILLSADPEFKEKAEGLCRELDIRVGFDTAGGQVAADVINAMVTGGVLYIYEDCLNSQEITGISPQALIFQKKKLIGLNLFPWFRHKKSLQKLTLLRHIQQNHFLYRSDILHTFDMTNALDALEAVRTSESRGLILIHLRALPTSRLTSNPISPVTGPAEETKTAPQPTGEIAIAVDELGEDEDDRDIQQVPELPGTKFAPSLSAGIEDGGDEEEGDNLSPQLDIVQHTS